MELKNACPLLCSSPAITGLTNLCPCDLVSGMLHVLQQGSCSTRSTPPHPAENKHIPINDLLLWTSGGMTCCVHALLLQDGREVEKVVGVQAPTLTRFITDLSLTKAPAEKPAPAAAAE